MKVMINLNYLVFIFLIIKLIDRYQCVLDGFEVYEIVLYLVRFGYWSEQIFLWNVLLVLKYQYFLCVWFVIVKDYFKGKY